MKRIMALLICLAVMFGMMIVTPVSATTSQTQTVSWNEHTSIATWLVGQYASPQTEYYGVRFNATGAFSGIGFYFFGSGNLTAKVYSWHEDYANTVNQEPVRSVNVSVMEGMQDILFEQLTAGEYLVVFTEMIYTDNGFGLYETASTDASLGTIAANGYIKMYTDRAENYANYAVGRIVFTSAYEGTGFAALSQTQTVSWNEHTSIATWLVGQYASPQTEYYGVRFNATGAFSGIGFYFFGSGNLTAKVYSWHEDYANTVNQEPVRSVNVSVMEGMQDILFEQLTAGEYLVVFTEMIYTDNGFGLYETASTDASLGTIAANGYIKMYTDRAENYANYAVGRIVFTSAYEGTGFVALSQAEDEDDQKENPITGDGIRIGTMVVFILMPACCAIILVHKRKFKYDI